MNEAARIGILGGTLDPIHLGHIEAALAAREALRLERVIIVPAHVPPHRSRPATSAFHRFAMAALAVAGIDGLCVSDVELLAPGPSYTADTLDHAADEHGLDRSQIFFITGADAFAEIETWKRYPDVLELANFVVVSRPGMSLVDLRSRLPQLRQRMRLPLGRAHSGITSPERTSIFLVDAPTPDVSSTEIRRLVARGERVMGMVPPNVEQHILQHGLYVPKVAPTSRAEHLHGENRT
jgi:nicotinate-nucleotide adenylyltransferase